MSDSRTWAADRDEAEEYAKKEIQKALKRIPCGEVELLQRLEYEYRGKNSPDDFTVDEILELIQQRRQEIRELTIALSNKL